MLCEAGGAAPVYTGDHAPAGVCQPNPALGPGLPQHSSRASGPGGGAADLRGRGAFPGGGDLLQCEGRGPADL